MKNKKTLSNKFVCSILFLLAAAGFAGCQADQDTAPDQDQIDVGNVPHREVPQEFQGDFMWSHTSSSGYNDDYGGAYTALSVGAAAHLNKNGTGTWVFRYDIHYASGGSKSVHIDSDVAYEITKTSSNRADITVHFVRGKNYEDGKFLRNLDASVIYPNGDYIWQNVEYGIKEDGKMYFKPGPDLIFTKK